MWIILLSGYIGVALCRETPICDLDLGSRIKGLGLRV